MMPKPRGSRPSIAALTRAGERKASDIVMRIEDAVLEFLFGCDADMAQDRAGELGEEAFDEVEPRAVLGGEGEFEAAGGLIGEPGFGFLGDVRGMIVEVNLIAVRVG